MARDCADRSNSHAAFLTMNFTRRVNLDTQWSDTASGGDHSSDTAAFNRSGAASDGEPAHNHSCLRRSFDIPLQVIDPRISILQPEKGNALLSIPDSPIFDHQMPDFEPESADTFTSIHDALPSPNGSNTAIGGDPMPRQSSGMDDIGTTARLSQAPHFHVLECSHSLEWKQQRKKQICEFSQWFKPAGGIFCKMRDAQKGEWDSTGEAQRLWQCKGCHIKVCPQHTNHLYPKGGWEFLKEHRSGKTAQKWNDSRQARQNKKLRRL